MGGGGRPAVQKIEDPPAVTDPAIAAALEKERLLARKKKGRASTILSQGEETQATPQQGQKTLLGE